jgi:hypothetical protein
MDQMALRKAIFAQPDKLKTLDGGFMLDEHGAQTGEITPLGQLAGNPTLAEITRGPYGIGPAGGFAPNFARRQITRPDSSNP